MKHLSFIFFFILFFLSIQGQSFMVIQGSGDIYPHGLSSDGQYVTGQVGTATSTSGHHTFVWNPADGLAEWDQNSANADGQGSTGRVISNSGRVAGVAPDPTRLVDTYEDYQLPIITASFRDYDSSAWTFLPLLENINPLFYYFGSKVYGITDNGGMIVGGQTPGGQAGFFSAGYWDVSNPAGVEYHSLSTATTINNNNNSVASAVSGDGRIIGGQEKVSGTNYTVIWTDGVKKRISGTSGDAITAISPNGKYAVLQNGLRAALYTIATEQLEVFDLSTETASLPLDVSDNGIVVGQWNPIGSDQKSFIYTRSTGMLPLKSLLDSYNISCPLSSISAVSGISADGRIITGYGTLGGKTVGFYAEIPDIASDKFPVKDIDINTPAYGTVVLNWEAPKNPVITPIAYHVYEGDNLIGRLNTLTTDTTFTGVAEGTYLYSVKVVYEEGNGEAESIAGKTAAVTVSKKTIPFYDSFGAYQTGGLQFDQTFQDEIPLSTGGWDVSAHAVPFSEAWSVNGSGRPPCSAGFIAPLSGEYDESLNSPFFDLQEVEDLFLAFEIGVPGSSSPNGEKLAVEIYDGETWYKVDEIPSAGQSVLFSNRYYDLSAYAGKDNIRFRFRCFGTATTGLNWFIDNVELTDGANRVSIKEPWVISARQTGDGKVHINWSDPYGKVSLRYMFDDDAFGALNNSQYPYIAANMYPAEDLTAYDGYYLTSISFWRTTNNNPQLLTKPTQFRWFASQGGERLVSDTIINAKLKWNTVQLDKPVRIDATKPLYYGVEVTDADPDDWPVGSGAYYQPGASPYEAYVNLDKIDGRGNLYSEDGGQTWRKVSEDGEEFAYDLFCVRATLSKDSIPVSDLLTRRITGYKIYRNGTESLLAEEQGSDYSVSLNNFTDVNPGSGEVCYTVKTYFYDYEAGHTLSSGISDCITVTGIDLVRDADGWNVYPNPVKSNETIQVKINDLQQTSYSIRLYDLSGKIVKEVNTNALLTPVKLDVESGTYILKITDNKAIKLIVE